MLNTAIRYAAKPTDVCPLQKQDRQICWDKTAWLAQCQHTQQFSDENTKKLQVSLYMGEASKNTESPFQSFYSAPVGRGQVGQLGRNTKGKNPCPAPHPIHCIARSAYA